MAEQGEKADYQGIVLFVNERMLNSKLYFSSQKSEFKKDVEAGQLEDLALSIKAKIVASKWLHEPVTRTKFREINSKFYNETLSKLTGGSS